MICDNVQCENYDPKSKSHCFGESMIFVRSCRDSFQMVQMIEDGCFIIAENYYIVKQSYTYKSKRGLL